MKEREQVGVNLHENYDIVSSDSVLLLSYFFLSYLVLAFKLISCPCSHFIALTMN